MMQAFVDQLMNALTLDNLYHDNMTVIQKALKKVDKGQQFEPGTITFFLKIIDKALTQLASDEKIIESTLKLLVIASHYRGLIQGLMMLNSKSYFQAPFEFDEHIEDPDRLIYILIALIDSPIYKDQSIAVLEGISFYAIGKKRCMLCGLVNIMDKVIQSVESDYTNNFTIKHCMYLECFSNLICCQQARNLETDGCQVLSKLSCHKSVHDAILTSRNTKQARCAISCMFGLILDNYDLWEQQGLISEQLINKLLFISSTHCDGYGGRVASLVLILLVANKARLSAEFNQEDEEQQPLSCVPQKQENNDQNETEDMKYLSQNVNKDLFKYIRESVQHFKTIQEQLKNLHLVGEQFLFLEEFEHNNLYADDDYNHFFNQFQEQVSEMRSKSAIALKEINFLSQNTPMRSVSQFGGEIRTTGALRGGIVRTKAKSSLTEW